MTLPRTCFIFIIISINKQFMIGREINVRSACNLIYNVFCVCFSWLILCLNIARHDVQRFLRFPQENVTSKYSDVWYSKFSGFFPLLIVCLNIATQDKQRFLGLVSQNLTSKYRATYMICNVFCFPRSKFCV